MYMSMKRISISRLSRILRVALAAFPRPQVASLYGAEWITFLSATCTGTSLASLATTEPGDDVSLELRGSAGAWIRHHRAPAAPAQGNEH